MSRVPIDKSTFTHCSAKCNTELQTALEKEKTEHVTKIVKIFFFTGVNVAYHWCRTVSRLAKTPSLGIKICVLFM